MDQRLALILACLAGSVAALSLPPFDAWVLLVPALAVVTTLVSGAQRARGAFFLAWSAGLGWFGLSMHWIVQPFFVEPEIYGWMAPFALALLAGGLSLFWGLAGALAWRIGRSAGACALCFGSLLTLAEALRGRLFTGLPWAQPGHGWIASEALALSAFVGPLGLTLIALLLAASSAALFASRRSTLAVLPLIVSLALGVTPLRPEPVLTRPDAPMVRVVQINAPQHLKWDPEMIPVFFDRALELSSRPSDVALDLIVWPETSLPDLLRHSEPARARIADASGGAQVIVGGQRYAGFEPRNTLVALAPDGEVAAIYDKHHLVPFGEYIPLRNLADRLGFAGLAQRLRGGYWPGPGPQLLDLGPLGRAFPMICYESIFPQYLFQAERPDFLVVITNDAWFGSFAMPYQHLALARLRAAESGLPVIRAANTGVSAVIDPRGAVVDALNMDEPGIIDAALPDPLPPTLYVRSGDVITFLMAIVLLLSGIIPGRARYFN